MHDNEIRRLGDLKKCNTFVIQLDHIYLIDLSCSNKEMGNLQKNLATCSVGNKFEHRINCNV